MSKLLKIKKAISGWAMSDFPAPRKVPVPVVTQQRLLEAKHDVDSAEWLILEQNVTDEQVSLIRKETTLASLQQLDLVTSDLRQHDWYTLDRHSVEMYQKLATKVGFFGRLKYRFKQFFFAVEGQLRHRGFLGFISAAVGSIWPLVVLEVLLYNILPERTRQSAGILYLLLGALYIGTSVGYAQKMIPYLYKDATAAEESAALDVGIYALGRAFATLNFILFFFIPTLLLSALWATVSWPITKGLETQRHYREISLAEFVGELPQDVQDVAFGLGKTIPSLSFSLEVLYDKLSSKQKMADDPFFICRYGTEPDDKLYLWHELAV